MINIYLDENAGDLDFEDSLDKSHPTPTVNSESEKTPLPKPSLSFVFNFENKIYRFFFDLQGLIKSHWVIMQRWRLISKAKVFFCQYYKS